MSEFNPYMDICTWDPYGAQNIACVAVFHHSDDPCEHDELQRSPNDGQEHDDFILLPLPSDQAQHVDQAQSILPNISDQAKHSHSSTVSTVKTETSEQKNVSNIFFFSENILFNTIEYI